jgi:hypothetical protein
MSPLLCAPVLLAPCAEMQAFDGLGPEVTNSRLAMLGFAMAAFWELTQGIDVFQQVHKYPLLTIATFVIFTAASWIPFMQGQSYNVKSGPFTPAVSQHLRVSVHPVLSIRWGWHSIRICSCCFAVTAVAACCCCCWAVLDQCRSHRQVHCNLAYGCMLLRF